jgi:integrase
LFPNIQNGKPWISGSVNAKPLDRLKAVAARAGVTEGVTFQALRRTCATTMEAAGAGAAQIQRQLRHSNVGVTQQFYMQADRDNMKSAMDGFSY